MAGKFELYKDKAGMWRFRLRAGNGEIIATGEAYESRQAAERAITTVKRTAETAESIVVGPSSGQLRSGLIVGRPIELHVTVEGGEPHESEELRGWLSREWPEQPAHPGADAQGHFETEPSRLVIPIEQPERVGEVFHVLSRWLRLRPERPTLRVTMGEETLAISANTETDELLRSLNLEYGGPPPGPDFPTDR